MRRTLPGVVLLVVLALGAAGHGALSAAQATPLVFELINVPGSNQTRANGISPDFVTGLYITGGVNHGFLYFPAWNHFKRLDVPNVVHTQLQKGRLAGGVVGFYQTVNGAAMRGFRYNFSGATFDLLDYPGSSSTTPWGVNVQGHVVGGYGDSTGQHAFLLKDGAYTNIDVPNAANSTALDINVHGDIVGRYNMSGGQTLMFLRTRDGAYQTISVPGSVFTGNPGFPGGINDHGDIVGMYQDQQDMKVRGFLLDATGYHPLDDANPARFFFVAADGIDNDGNIAGRLRVTGAAGDSGFLIRRQR